VFYGDEVGVTGGEDPFNRATYPWADLGGKPDVALLADYRRLIKVRNENPVLRHGSIEAPMHLDEHVIVLPRREGDQVAIVAMNNDAAVHEVTIELPEALGGVTFTDAWDGSATLAQGRALRVTVPATSGSVLLAQVPKPASTAQANVHVLPPLAMPQLGRERTIRVYLPPGYEHSRKRYPVLYMHDGQNLFDAATSFLGEWGVDETLNDLAKSKNLQLIVVGIDNGGAMRNTELNAWDNPDHKKGEGHEYMQFIVETVKPYIDAHYRTQRDRDHTAIMGSSLGGLISHYAICEYPNVFGKAGIFSPAYWYAPAVADYTAAHRLPAKTRIYFYVGGKEDEHMVGNMQDIVTLMREHGLAERNVSVHIEPQAQHNEAAWRAEFPRAVEWLFAK